MRSLEPVIRRIALGAAVLALSGCAEESGERRYKVHHGIVSKIDHRTGEVGMKVLDEEDHELVVEGVVTPDTEILINGRVAAMQDVRLNEQVIVEGYRAEGKKWVVTKVRVERPTANPPATAPATSPSAAG